MCAFSKSSKMKLGAFRGGLFNPKKNKGVPLKSIDISCKVSNLLADVSTKFVYENDTKEALEAKFVFPLNDVTVYHFEATINDRKIVAECRARAEAQATYDDAVEAGHSAFLAEQDEHCDDVFQMSVGNIPPLGKILILLKYVGLLKADLIHKHDSDLQSQLTFTLPTVLNPRYSPQSTGRRFDGFLTRHEEDFTIPSESDPFIQPPAWNKHMYTMSFEAELDMPCPIVDVTSPNDEYKVERKSNSLTCASVKISSKFKPNHDLQMVIRLAQKLESMTLIEPGKPDNVGLMSMNCLMTQFVPDFTELATMKESRSEIVFLIDRSGSMAGSRIKFAQTSLLLFLKSLPPGCRFQIIGFGSMHSALFTEPTDYSEQSLNQALGYQANLEANMGGTEVYSALKAAFDGPLTGQGWHRQIIFLTDGDVWNTDAVVGLTNMNVDKARVFTIGLGEGASTAMVEGLARAGRGLSASIHDNSQLNAAVMRILNAALQPRANDLEIQWNLFELEADGHKKPLDVITVPDQLLPIFYGQFTSAFAFFKCGNPSNVGGSVSLTFDLKSKRELTAQINGSGRTTLVNVDDECASDLPVHRLACKAQLQQWINQYDLCMLKKPNQNETGESVEPGEADQIKALRKEIENLSCQTNILSKFTSLVGVDPTCRLTPDQRVRRLPVPSTVSGSFYPQFLCGAGDLSCQYDEVLEKGSYGMQCAVVSIPVSDSDMSLTGTGVSSSGIPAESYEPGPVDTSQASHIQLAVLQQFCGSWKLDRDLARIIHVPLETLEKSMPKTWPSDASQSMTDEVWATALVLAYLELYQSAYEVEWSLIADKARDWLIGQVPKADSAKYDCSELIKIAKLILKKH